MKTSGRKPFIFTERAVDSLTDPERGASRIPIYDQIGELALVDRYDPRASAEES